MAPLLLLATKDAWTLFYALATFGVGSYLVFSAWKEQAVWLRGEGKVKASEKPVLFWCGFSVYVFVMSWGVYTLGFWLFTGRVPG